MEYIPYICVIVACFGFLGHQAEIERRAHALRQRLARRVTRRRKR